MKRDILLLPVVTSALVGSLLEAQTTSDVGVLSGVVRDESGAPLAGVRITYDRIYASMGPVRNPVLAPGESIARGTIATDAGGSFQIPALPIGRFRVCASVPSAPFLDPCKWEQARIAVVAGNVTAPISVTLKKGVYLRVRINDPEGRLAAVKESPISAGGLIVGVKFGSGAFLGSEELSVSAGGRDYRMVVPAGVPCSLYLFSRHFSLVDGTGAKVNVSDVLIPFQAKAGVDQSFTFSVSGLQSP